MKLLKINVIILVLLVCFMACKTQHEPGYLKYQPVFNQLENAPVNTTKADLSALDTIVLIRSNLRERIDTIKKTYVFDQVFSITRGELAIPLEILNRKPPKFDTFLVAREYIFHQDLMQILFPKSLDSLSKIDGNIEDVVAIPSISDNDLIEVVDSASNGFSVQKVSLAQKKYYSIDEIKQRVPYANNEVDSIIQSVLSEVPWKINDSIPFVEGVETDFKDSLLILRFDTLRVRRFVPEDVIPQLPYKTLVDEKKEMVFDRDTVFVKVPVRFLFYYPDEEDVFLEMVRVQGGTFKMGSDEFDEDERPATKLSVSSFLIGKYEITNRLFCFFLNDGNCDSLGQVDGLPVIDLENKFTYIHYNKKEKKYLADMGMEEYPVVNVTWIGAQMFCKYVGGRLVSEAEWEYAARGGVYAHCHYLNNDKSDFEYEYNYAGGSYMSPLGAFVDNSFGDRHKGGSYRPNELGIYDMSGNVWEWCYDKYSSTFLQHNGKSRDPMNLAGADTRVNKGGSWSSDAMYCRVNNRNFLGQFERNPYLGFRLWHKW